MSENSEKPFRSGFVSILGRPNAGKSTLLNALVGTKLAIVADKPQTTRTLVQGVVTLPHAQIVFLDTPGIHDSKNLLNRRMMDHVRAAVEERDLLLYVADAAHGDLEADRRALDLARKGGAPLALVLSKADLLDNKNKLLPMIERYGEIGPFTAIVPVSARTGEGLEHLRDVIVDSLPAAPALFPDDYLTDQPERFLASEMIREKILHETRQEVPHSVAVVVDEWRDEKHLTRISATIFVERTGQKAIIIGSKGAMMKRIGTAAREEIEKMLDRRVYLELFVKVREAWRDSPEFLNELFQAARAVNPDE